MQKEITLRFNILMTLVLVVYVSIAGLYTDPDPNYVIDEIVEFDPLVGIVAAIVSIILLIIIFMYGIRALWNRLFPKLCGWKEINLAEAYALSLILGFCIPT